LAIKTKKLSVTDLFITLTIIFATKIFGKMDKKEISKVALTIVFTALGVAGGMLLYDRVLRK
jgi:hypothetical protein